jgi:pentatricopeptide repeat protein
LRKKNHQTPIIAMMECRACVSRAIRAVVGDVHAASSTFQRSLVLTPHFTTQLPRRRISTAVETNPRDALSDLEPLPRPKIIEAPGKKGGSIVISNEKSLQRELEWLKDPVKLAQHINYTLRNEEAEKALNLCRLASRKMECVVSWNHVVAWHMARGKVNAAIDIFNEMKKRGQYPDSYTYMRMFQGFTDQTQHLNKAISIYHSMGSPTSRVRPSIMHTNAVLRLCALATDSDALWGIVSRLPDSGPNSADETTYTTILQGIRHCALGEEEDPLMMARKRQEAVNEGRRIWQEIVARWRAGQMIIDEQLVVAMADLLLLSRRMQDWDDVLNLVQQTTAMDRLVPALDERNTEHVPKDLIDEDVDMRAQLATQEDPDGFIPTPSANAFKPVAPLVHDPNRPKRKASLVWVKPGNGILSMLIRACTVMRHPKGVWAYFDALTAPPHNIRPDVANFIHLFGLLRINRNDAKAAHLLRRMHEEMGVKPHPRTYQLAMGAAARNSKNPNVMVHATEMISNMEKHLRVPDVSTLEQYLSIALRTGSGPDIITALDKIIPLLPKVLEHINSGSGEKQEIMQRDRDTALSLLQAMIGSVDTLMSRALTPKGTRRSWEERRSELDKQLSTLKFNLKGNERPAGRTARGAPYMRQSLGSRGALYDFKKRRGPDRSSS